MKTVLLVDDAPSILQVLNATLKQTYKTKVAVSGEKALRIAARDPKPNLILLDISMPEMDGFEVCKRLKDNPETKDIPVIFLSGKDSLSYRSKGLSLGAVDFIEKPIDVERVCIWVEQHIGKSVEDGERAE